MKNKEAKKVIEEYKPHKGYLNLSVKPEKISNIEYAKILDSQNLLIRMEKEKEYLKEFNPTQWFEIQEISAKLQRIILYYWGDSVFV